jgi:hypothetical protein
MIPLAKIIVPDAAKQKYVKPEIKTKNIWLSSISDILSASIKHADTETFLEHIEIKCFSMYGMASDMLSLGTTKSANAPKNKPVKNIK